MYSLEEATIQDAKKRALIAWQGEPLSEKMDFLVLVTKFAH